MNWMNPDNVVHAALNKVGDVVIANLLFLLCSIPLVTIGPALSALYHCMLRTVKGNHTFTVKTFFTAFRQNFIQALLIWLVLCAALIMAAFNLRFLAHTDSPAGQIFFLLTCGTAVLLAITAFYVFPVIAAFKGTWKMQLKNALLFAFSHLPSTLLIILISTLPMVMTWLDTGLLPLYACCWFFFGFGLTAYLNSLLFYRMFRPYLEQEAQEVADHG